MINLGMEPRSSTSATAEKAISMLSKGWREVRDSADADLRLMRARANSFKNIADRELENFLNSAPTFSPSVPQPDGSIAEFEFVKRIQPKISEIRRAYSSPDFSRKVLEKWTPTTARIRINLSEIKNAFVSDVRWVPDFDGDMVRRRVRKLRWKEEEEAAKEWEPIQMLKTTLKELEQKSQSYEVFGNFKSSEFMEKVKLSLKSIYKEPQGSQDRRASDPIINPRFTAESRWQPGTIPSLIYLLDGEPMASADLNAPPCAMMDVIKVEAVRLTAATEFLACASRSLKDVEDRSAALEEAKEMISTQTRAIKNLQADIKRSEGREKILENEKSSLQEKLTKAENSLKRARDKVDLYYIAGKKAAKQRDDIFDDFKRLQALGMEHGIELILEEDDGVEAEENAEDEDAAVETGANQKTDDAETLTVDKGDETQLSP